MSPGVNDIWRGRGEASRECCVMTRPLKSLMERSDQRNGTEQRVRVHHLEQIVGTLDFKIEIGSFSAFGMSYLKKNLYSLFLLIMDYFKKSVNI